MIYKLLIILSVILFFASPLFYIIAIIRSFRKILKKQYVSMKYIIFISIISLTAMFLSLIILVYIVSLKLI